MTNERELTLLKVIRATVILAVLAFVVFIVTTIKESARGTSCIVQAEIVSGTSSSSIYSEATVVGVKFEIQGHLFLEDLTLKHSELAYYKGKNTIPLKVTINNEGHMKIELNGRQVLANSDLLGVAKSQCVNSDATTIEIMQEMKK